MAHSKQIVQNPTAVAGIAILAAGVGAVTAMLFTPKSGKDLRADMKAKAQNSRDKAHDHAQMMKHKMHHTAEDIQEKVMDATEAAQGTMHDVADKLSDTAKDKADEAAAKSKAVSDNIEDELRRRNKKDQ
jgi:gas vesicle protein